MCDPVQTQICRLGGLPILDPASGEACGFAQILGNRLHEFRALSTQRMSSHVRRQESVRVTRKGDLPGGST
jgi:hypothetical protein